MEFLKKNMREAHEFIVRKTENNKTDKPTLQLLKNELEEMKKSVQETTGKINTMIQNITVDIPISQKQHTRRQKMVRDYQLEKNRHQKQKQKQQRVHKKAKTLYPSLASKKDRQNDLMQMRRNDSSMEIQNQNQFKSLTNFQTQKQSQKQKKK